jgi:predicted nucleotidyltransferase
MSDISNFIQGQITKKKLEKGLEMLHNENPAELKKKLQSIDIDEILQKMDEYDKKRLQELGINVSELKSRVSEADIQKIQQALGQDSERVIRKLRNMLR